jgi:AAA domain
MTENITEEKILDFFGPTEKPSAEARAKAAQTDTLPLLLGSNPIEYAGRTINGEDCLLADRFLERGTSMLLVAPSGIGKSTAVMQAAILWSCGKEAFSIAPTRTLRVLIVQAEDNTADLKDQARVVDYLVLTPAERQCVEHNCWIETVNDKVGLEAIVLLDGVLKQHPTDLLIINPYTAYYDGEIRDDQANRIFLRGHLQRLINRYRIGVILVHHTPKTNFRKGSDSWNIYDWMYSAAGAAELTQWARAVLAIDPIGDSGTFKFIAAKRGDRIGWDHRIKYFAHDPRPGVLLWNETSKANAESAAATKVTGSVDDLVKLVPMLDSIPKTELEARAMAARFTQKHYRALLERALLDKKLYSVKIPNPGARSIAGISRTPAPETDPLPL